MGNYRTPVSTNAQDVLRVLLFSSDNDVWNALTGAIADLQLPGMWQQYGTMTPEEIAAYFFDVWLEYLNVSLVGVILPYATATCPTFALPCDGAVYARVDYPSLYAALADDFHIDADNFFVPDLRFSLPLASSGGHPIGEVGGEETHTLTTTELPAHTHTDTGHVHTEGIAIPAVGAALVGVPIPSGIPSPGLTGIGYAAISSSGGGGAHNNMPPYTVIPGWCIIAS
jgi:microcystin-dependent protein